MDYFKSFYSNYFIFSLSKRQNNHYSTTLRMLPSSLPPPSSTVTIPSCSSLSGRDISRDRNWSDIELAKLSSFMLFHSEKFQGERVRKQARVFSVLSRYLKSRNVNQCRYYVHKLLSKFGYPEQIVLFFRQSLKNFEENYRKELPLLKKIVFPLKSARNVQKKNVKEGVQIQVKEEMAEDNIKMKPTDVSYSEQTLKRPQKLQQKCEELFQNNLEQKMQKESFGKHYPSITSSTLEESCFSSHYYSPKYQQKKWQDCYDKFLEWTSKTAKLLERLRDRQPLPPSF